MKTNNNLQDILHEIGLPTTGRYINHFYVIDLADSNEYSQVYTLLDTNTLNTEDPTFGKSDTGSVERITNYFEYTFSAITYNIFLIADFKNDRYYMKIGQQ